MKRTLLLLLMLSILCCGADLTAKKRRKKQSRRDPGKTEASRSPASERSGGEKLWIGVASDTAVVRSATPAISAAFVLNRKAFIQLYFLIPTIKPFLFSLGGNYKTTLVGGLKRGFHLGGGLGLGRFAATDGMFLRINGIIGFHFQLVKRIMINVDSSLTLALDDSTFDLGIGGNSTLLGISVFFRL